jgi:large subunit ribosomal protein L29
MRPEELRDRTEEELQNLLSEKREALSNLRFKRVTDVIEDPSKFEKTKRDIARILTILNEREQVAEPEA